jgi:KamA family protein
LSTAIDWLANNESIREVILSGGDPLLVPNQVLSAWFERIAALSHIRAIRIHSRLPVVLPERMTEDLLQLLRSVSRRLVLVIHANHAHEIRGDCAEKLRYLTSNGITILNQSVLLAGVNDTYAALSDLSWQLHEVGVLPYYLHQLDYVTGAMHFAVPDARATQLIEQLRGNLPGFLVPRLVREEPGAVSKSPIYS